MSEHTPECPDCKSAMQPIKIIDATDGSWDGKGTSHVPLAYAAPDARRSFFLGKIPAMGFQTGFIWSRVRPGHSVRSASQTSRPLTAPALFSN